MLRVPPWMDGIAFSIAEGRAAGFTDAQMRGSAFARPFHGVRVIGTSGRVDGGLIDRCADLSVVLSEDAMFSHATAARLWGMPLPRHLAENLHVLCIGSTPVRRPGVIAWSRRDNLGWPRSAHGFAVTSPADTWAALASMTESRGGRVSPEWLVAIGDFLVSGRRTRYGREPALCSSADLAAAVAARGSGRGVIALRWALKRIRKPVDSPPETFTRLGLVRAGLPEPVVQPDIPTAAGVRHPDLGYLDERVLIEYLGDVHRVDAATWRADLTRVQLFQDAGYSVILAAAGDISAAGMPGFAARVARALRRS